MALNWLMALALLLPAAIAENPTPIVMWHGMGKLISSVPPGDVVSGVITMKISCKNNAKQCVPPPPAPSYLGLCYKTATLAKFGVRLSML